MSGMQDDFESGLRAGFEDADKAREGAKFVKGLVDKAPEALAGKIVAAFPREMEELREQAASEWGVDIADLDNPRDVEIDFCNPSELFLLLLAANRYRVCAELLRRLDAHAADPSLSRDGLITRVCEAGLKAMKAFEAAKLHTLREIRIWFEKNGTKAAARYAADTETRYLAGHLATGISMRNKRLARALDDLRERKKPAPRERFEVLLWELYVLAPGAWDEHHRTDWLLHATRSAVVKRIEQRLLGKEAAPPEEIELATFAEREAALKKGREAGLAPREYEIFKLFLENPKIKYREVAERLGISVGTVGKTKARIGEALAQAG